MLHRDLNWYQVVLRHLSLGELLALYERTGPEYGTLARIIAEELNHRLGAAVTGAV